MAALLPLTSFDDDVAALSRALERVQEPVVLASHAYAGAVIGAARDERVKALVYVAARVRSHPVDHTPLVTAPQVVAAIIREAVAAVGNH